MKLVFTTERGERHQQHAVNAAPPGLDITMLRQPDRDTLMAHLTDADYLISERVGVIDAATIRAAPKLKLILRLGSLTHDIDTDAAREAGVIVCRWPDVSTVRVAEHVVMAILALTKKLRETEAVGRAAESIWGNPRPTDEDTFAYNWSRRTGIGGLWNSTVGIVGFGEIGAELARRLAGWGCTLLYHKRRRLPEPVETALNLVYDPDLIEKSAVVVNTLPYFPETVNYFNAERFAAMPDGAVFVSVGSGGTVDQAALAAAMRSGKLSGCAMDSYAIEPLPGDDPLVAAANYNILLTPHVAAGTDANLRAAEYTNIVNHMQGRPLVNRVG